MRPNLRPNIRLRCWWWAAVCAAAPAVLSAFGAERDWRPLEAAAQELRESSAALQEAASEPTLAKATEIRRLAEAISDQVDTLAADKSNSSPSSLTKLRDDAQSLDSQLNEILATAGGDFRRQAEATFKKTADFRKLLEQARD